MYSFGPNYAWGLQTIYSKVVNQACNWVLSVGPYFSFDPIMVGH